MELRKFQEMGVQYVEDVIPEGWETVKEYTPSSCPWDYYGMKWGQRFLKVMRAADIPAEISELRKTSLHPTGTGYKGAVRFGDNMMPHDYRLIVPSDRVKDAMAAIDAHELAVSFWLDGMGDMPEACKV